MRTGLRCTSSEDWFEDFVTARATLCYVRCTSGPVIVSGSFVGRLCPLRGRKRSTRTASRNDEKPAAHRSKPCMRSCWSEPITFKQFSQFDADNFLLTAAEASQSNVLRSSTAKWVRAHDLHTPPRKRLIPKLNHSDPSSGPYIIGAISYSL